MGLEQIGLEAILKDENFQAGLKRYEQGVNQMEKSTDSAANVLTRLGSIASGALVVGLGAATAAFGAFLGISNQGLNQLIQWGEGLDKLGDQFGLTGDKASGFAFLAAKVGAPVDELGFALNSLTNGLQSVEDRVRSGSKTISPFEKGLGTLGVSAFKANGKLKTFDELLPELMDGFKKLPSGIKASSVAMDIFGTRGGGKMLDFLRQGSVGLADATKKAKAYGLALSGEETDAVENFGFAQNELKLAIEGAWVSIGRSVLPVAQKFVDLLIQNMPRITAFAQSLGRAFTALVKGVTSGDWRDFGTILDKVFGRDMANNIGTFILAVQNVVKAFQTGGLSGALDEFKRLLGKAFEGFDLSKTLGDIGGKVAGAIRAAWTIISPELERWGNQFWDWLTKKGGALDQAGSQLEKVVGKMIVWVKQNGPEVWGLIEQWAGNFWNWLTDSKGGLLITVAENMQKLATTIENWAKDPQTVVQFQKVGEDLARNILDGIGNFFTNPSPSGENILMRLLTTLNNARMSLTNTIASLGGALAGGIIGGIVGYFLGAEAQKKVTDALTKFFTELQKIMLSPFGPVFGFAIAMAQYAWDSFIARWNSLFGAWGGGSSGSGGSLGTGGGSVGSGQSSGFGFNSPVQQPVINNTSASNRTINVNVPVTGSFDGMDKNSVEYIAQQIADRTLAAVLSAA